jgi:hypothetical protein
MSISSLPTSSTASTSTSTNTTASAAASSTPSTSTTLSASITASLQEEAGVVATFSGSTPTDSSSDLYTNLANLAVSASAPAVSSSIDLNSNWASVVQSNPDMATLATQMAANQALLTAVL